MVWCLSNLRWVVISQWITNARDWIFQMRQRVDQQEFQLFLVICWSIWWSRNKKCADNELISSEQTVSYTWHYLNAFAISLDPHHSLGLDQIYSIWIASPPGFIKLNLDVAIFQSVGNFGVGVVARDSDGHYLAWSAIRLHRSLSPEVAEAWAARIESQLAHRFGWTNIVLEGDCASVYSHLSSPGAYSSTISPVIFDIISLSSSFSSCVFSLVRRSGNTLAHSLAQHAVSRDEGTDLLPSPACTLAWQICLRNESLFLSKNK
ncbi:UNVERIFIED_CONTAM: hypothetical protein Slati_3874600 [Sesamum latifolium]|uniref:RNase H type-1 domain-containing protein n=1 Tax=Sesamum latifolium TaxID=2727402 RepID=A0AAW2TMS9_9LAMI